VATHAQQTETTSTPHHTTSLLIHHLWTFMLAIWAYRNSIAHGSTTEELAQVLLAALHDKILSHYDQYHTDEHYILPHHKYLFTHRTLDDRLHHSYDHLTL
jgi:hypothetical protein